MTSNGLDDTLTGTMHCPTCKARQQWSDTCRRCKSDLTLLHRTARYSAELRRKCLRQLRSGHTSAARHTARTCVSLKPDADAIRLLAVSCLLHGDWPQALRIVKRYSEETRKHQHPLE